MNTASLARRGPFCDPKNIECDGTNNPQILAAIVVPIVVGSLLVCVGAWFLWRHLKRRRLAAQAAASAPVPLAAPDSRTYNQIET
ncbi:hypothetical protein B0H13DRAFT_2660173 [Mycena leptocephala]|nr:hypothetical protein B0H13DRAFT_2660173 [Mycena leptocephala]